MTLVGTTETRFSGDPAQVRPLTAEVEYLLRTFHRYFPERDMQVRDQFAGLRVLPLAQGAAFHRPRETLCGTDAPEQPQLVSIYGGKLTGYRATAQKALALLRAALPVRQVRADTATLRLED
jgi:glycerol-3-phosphate dehydrogenase